MPAADPESTRPREAPPLGAGQIEIWKKIVDVQQHFNDLELRIRNFALIVTGAFLGLGGYAIKDAGIVSVFGLKISIAGLIVVSAVFPLAAFYFMDRLWYHRLLEGSVYAGIDAETALKELGYKVDLGSKIKQHSPFKLVFSNGKKIRSTTKMDLFYAILAGSLLLVAAFLCFGIRPHLVDDKTSPAVVGKLPTDGSSVASSSELPASNTQPVLPKPAPLMAAGSSNAAKPIMRNSQEVK